MTTFFSKMARRHTGISLSARFSTSTFQIGRAGQNDQVFCKWPPRSPDLTVFDFFLWGYVKDRVYVPPLPATVDELQEGITAAVNSVTPDMCVYTGCPRRNMPDFGRVFLMLKYNDITRNTYVQS